MSILNQLLIIFFLLFEESWTKFILRYELLMPSHKMSYIYYKNVLLYLEKVVGMASKKKVMKDEENNIIFL